MKTIFLETLKKISAFSPVKHWKELHLDFFLKIPGLKSLGIRLRWLKESASRDFFLSIPQAREEFIELLALDNILGLIAREAAKDDWKLPSSKPELGLFFSPLRKGTATLGELFLIVESGSQEDWKAWTQFCDQAAIILSDKVRRLFQTIVPPPSYEGSPILDTLIELHQVKNDQDFFHPSGTRESMIQSWADQDYDYLKKFLSIFQQKFDQENVFVVHKVALKAVQVVISSDKSSISELPNELRDTIEDVLGHFSMGSIDESIIRIFPGYRRRKSEPGKHVVFRSFACDAGNSTYGNFGLALYREDGNPEIFSLMSLLANHLGFRFAHLYQKRREEIHRQMLSQINGVCNIITSNVDIDGIIDQLISNLESLFVQNAGAVFLIPPSKKELECTRCFGKMPPEFDLQDVITNPDNFISTHIFDGTAFQRPFSDKDGLVRFILPFNPMPHFPFQPEGNFQHHSLGGLILYDVPENYPLTPDMVGFLTILLNGVSASLMVAFNYQDKLETIRALEGLINKLSNKDELLAEMILIIQKLLKVNRCSFLTVDPTGEFLTIEKAYGLSPAVVASTKIPVGYEISGLVAKTGKSLRSENIESDPRFLKRSLETYFNRSLLSVPLILSREDGSREVLGVINVNNKISGLTFYDHDQKLLEAIAELVVVALENSKLLKIQRTQDMAKAKYEAELTAACEVQTGMLPRNFEGLPPTLEVFGKSVPALHVGGDFFEGMPLKNGNWLFAIGDVAGKGMPAALLMATTRIILRSVAQDALDTPTILLRVNQILSLELNKINKEQDDFRFVTMSLAIIDPETGKGEFSSAGQGPVLMILDSEPALLEGESAPPLGFNFLPSSFKSVNFQLNPGDSMLFFTDGLSEERSPTGEMIGLESVKDLFVKWHKESTPKMVNGLIEAALNWRGPGEAHDDLTVLAIKFLGKTCEYI